ncbi:MAG: hypothetical protein ACPG32_05940 [Akkermansiaceae bacterium]
MKKTISLFSAAAALVLPICLTSCGEKKTDSDGDSSAAVVKKDTADSLTDEVLVQMSAMADALMGAKDKAGAETAAKKMDSVADELLAISKRMDKIEAPSEEERAKLEAKMEKGMDALEVKMKGFFQSLGTNEEVANVLGPAMQKMEQKLKPAEETFKKFGKKD